MKYSMTAVAVASLATSTFAAAVHNHANAHQRLHEREAQPAAEAEPEPTNYTYSDGQCWGAYGCDAKTGAPAAPTAAPAAPTHNAAPAVKAEAAPSYGGLAPGSSVDSAVSQVTSVASAASDVVSSVTGGSLNVNSFISSMKGDAKMLAPQSDGSCGEGDSHPNVVDITNDSGEDFLWVCWGSAGSWVNSKAPIMAHPVPNGKTATVSFANTPAGAQGGACAPAFTDSVIKNGQIQNTWLESTFNQWGTADVSREVTMSGHSITANTSTGCTTSMDQCVFKCTNGQDQCGVQNEDGSYDYGLMSCSGPGANPAPQDGGCFIGTGKMSVTVGPKA